jgi:HPt (histidine-containing phosphotransfer) domain-containing protein
MSGTIEFLEDKAGALTFDQVRSTEFSTMWIKHNDVNLSFGMSSSTYWVRFKITNLASSLQHIYLNVDYAPLRNVSMYALDQGTIQSTYRIGGTGFEDRPIKDRGFVFPIELKPGQPEVEIYLRVFSPYNSVLIPLRIHSADDFVISRMLQNVFHGIYIGVIMSMIFYNLLIYFSLRRKIYLYYVLSILSFLLFQLGMSGHGFQYLWPRSFRLQEVFNGFIIPLVVYFNNIFIFHFLSTHHPLTKKLHRKLRLFQTLAPFLSFSSFFYPNLYLNYFIVVYAVTYCTLIWGISILGWIKGDKRARFFVVAWTTLLWGTVIRASDIFGIIPSTFFSENIQQLGSMIQTIIFSLGLGDIILWERKIAQKNLEAANRELEQRVREQTRELRDKNEQLEKMNEVLEQRIAERIRAIKTILENVHSGFFMIDRKLVIEDGYTHSCVRFFNARIAAGQSILALLPLTDAQKDTLAASLEQVFEDQLPEQVTIAQVPQKFMVDGRYLSLDAAVVREPQTGQLVQILFTVNDVTALEKSYKEIESIKAIIGILKQKENFIDFLSETRVKLDDLRRAVSDDDLMAVRQTLHTIKGNAAVFNLTDFADRIHDMEESAFITTAHLDRLQQHLEGFLRINAALLGISAGEQIQETFQVAESSLNALEQEIAEITELHGIRKCVSAWIRSCRSKTAYEMLGPVEEYVSNVANRLGKEIRIQIDGGETRMATAVMEPIFKSLIHIIRNAIDHGIEPPEERGDKPRIGTIMIRFEETHMSWRILVSDDGRGINGKNLVERAIRLGRLPPHKAACLSEEQCWQLVFMDGLSTCDKATLLSGRGVGMSSFKAEVDARNGNLSITSKAGHGCSCIIEIPKESDQSLPLRKAG